MDSDLIDEIKSFIKGDVANDIITLDKFSHDASIFEVKPQLVVFPKDSSDVKNLVKFVNKNKQNYPELSLTARSAGTDMAGGPLNDSIIISFDRYFNRFVSLKNDVATAEPGMYYRDFEKKTLEKDLLFVSYPASKSICAIGGIVSNNSGGEKSLEYGKTEKFIESLKVILSDGNEYIVKPLSKNQLREKIARDNFEGQIYGKIFTLIDQNYELLQKTRPKVSKNSAGYFLWNVYNKKKQIFDLTQLFVGAQGTLGLITEASLKLNPVKRHAQMMIIFLSDLENLAKITESVLPLEPESFEAYDDNTLKLAVRFFPYFAKSLGAKHLIKTAWDFLPEFFLLLMGGLPKLILQVEFTSDDKKEIDFKIDKLQNILKPFNLKTKIAKSKSAAKKYWSIRRESFNLLRHKIRDKHTAPFIDDFVVSPHYLTEFLPKLYKIFEKYPSLIYTIAGHVGDGNFHIIPLMNIENPKEREIIPKLSEEVYDLVLKYHGSITGEHNDGLVRTPYLKKMYGTKICEIFEETKRIFDPLCVFNPRKKTGADLPFAMKHIRTSW